MALIQHLKPHNPAVEIGALRQFAPGIEWKPSGSTFNFPVTVGTGSLLIAGFSRRQSGTTTPPVAVSGVASSWTQIDTASTAYLYYGPSSGSGQSTTVTGLSEWTGIAFELTNVSSTLAAHAVNSGTGTVQSVTVNVPAAGQLVVVWRCRTTETQHGNQLTSTGWTHIGQPTDNSNNGVEAWYRTAPSSGNMTINWTASGSISWVAFAAVFAP